METFRALIPSPVRRLLRRVADRIPLHVALRPVRARFAGEEHRYEYQRRYVDFSIQPGDAVLDAGSGGDPFPHATVLMDRYLEPTPHRHGTLARDRRPFLCADIQQLPFADKAFNFVYAVHVLEHVDDPLRACRELMRVAKRGYVETPAMAEDVLFAWARERHRWHVVAIASTLCFFEYSERQREGIRSTAWEDVIADRRAHPLQRAYFENRDVFEVMFSWVDSFSVYVFHLDGRVETSA